jgi:hypothetical protein
MAQWKNLANQRHGSVSFHTKKKIPDPFFSAGKEKKKLTAV